MTGVDRPVLGVGEQPALPCTHQLNRKALCIPPHAGIRCLLVCDMDELILVGILVHLKGAKSREDGFLVQHVRLQL